jgi:hypothetical protein
MQHDLLYKQDMLGASSTHRDREVAVPLALGGANSYRSQR